MKTSSYPRNPYFTTTIYYLAFIGLGAATAVLGPTLQGLAQNTASTLAQISSLFLLTSFGYLLGSFASGRIYDRVRGHPVLSLGLLIAAALIAVVPLVRSLLYLQVLFFIIGIAQGSIDVGGNTLIIWLHGERVPPFMNGLHAFYGLGATFAPLIVAAVLSRTDSLNSIYWALTILIVPVSLLVLFFPSPSLSSARQQAQERPAVPAIVILLSVIFFAFTGAELGFGGWIYTFTTSMEYGTPTTAAGVNAAFWGAFTLSRLVSIPLAMKLRPQQMLWVDFVGVIASLLVIILFSSVDILLWIGAIGTGLFMASIFPTLLNYAQNYMQLSGRVTSWFFTGSSLGSMTLPWLMGQLIAPLGATAAMIAVLFSVLLAALIFALLNLSRHTVAPSWEPEAAKKTPGD